MQEVTQALTPQELENPGLAGGSLLDKEAFIQFIGTPMESPRSRSSQLKLFSLENPLTARFGNDFFRKLPRQPGVYFFYDSAETLLYIGQSLDLRARLGSYRHVAPEKHARRTLRLIHRVSRIDWQLCESAQEAVAKEAKLILEHRPPFNRAGVWVGDPWWFSVTADASRQLLMTNLSPYPLPDALGPLPSAFRVGLGLALRCLYRASHPAASLASGPSGLHDRRTPLYLSLPLTDAAAAADCLRAFACGQAEALLARLAALPAEGPELEQAYWLEEYEALQRYARKSNRLIPDRPLLIEPAANGLEMLWA